MYALFTSSSRRGLDKFDGSALTSPEEFRRHAVGRASEELAGLRQTLPDRPLGELIETYRRMTEIVQEVCEKFARDPGASRELRRFDCETDLYNLKRGDYVVFMGFSPREDRSSLGPLIEMFEEERLVLGESYKLRELPEIERGKTFAIRAPSGEMCHMSYCYFGREVSPSEKFVTEWSMG